MKKQKSLKSKMLLLIGLPVVAIFCITIAIVLQNLKQSVKQLTTENLASSSKTASFQINDFFLKNTEVAKQMSSNSQFEKLFSEVVAGEKINTAENFAETKRTMENVFKTDSDNFLSIWMGDVDSSQVAQSDGYLSDSSFVITTRPWYNQILESGDVIITEPYEDSVTKELVVSIIAPVYQTGTKTLLGVTGVDFYLDSVYTMMSGFKLGET
ncbi:MAG: cache domain-containing protein, partial [Oscillospiraceae bacterium]